MNFSFDNNLELKQRVRKKKTAADKNESADLSSLRSPADSLGGKDSANLAGYVPLDSLGRIDSIELARKSDETEFKKIRLIEGFGFNTAYNFYADSLKLSPLNVYFRTNLFDKININAGATFVPYKLNQFGMAIKQYAWEGGKFGLGSFTNANVSLSTSFQSKPKDPEKEKKRQEAINNSLNDPMLQADQQRLLEYMRTNPAEFVDFNTPWSFNISFQLSYYRGAYDLLKSKWANTITSSTMFGGSFNLTEKWNFSVNGGYDFSTMKLQTVSTSISRDLHCWQMSINVSPVGMYRYFSFTISPKAGVLQDLKINRNRSFYNGRGY